MKRLIRYTASVVCLFCVTTMFLSAQNDSLQTSKSESAASTLEWNLDVGFNIGGAMPVPIPREVRKIESYNPKINPHIGIRTTYNLDKKNNRWAIGSSLSLDSKGMRVSDRVKYMHAKVTVSEKGSADPRIVEGDFVGRNTTNVNMLYATISLFGRYTIHPKWELTAGLYGASTLKSTFDGDISDGYLLTDDGDRVVIDDGMTATFDFSDDIRDFDAGVVVGGKFKMNRNIGFFANMTWGLTDIFYRGANPINFKLQNVYGQIGISYNLK